MIQMRSPASRMSPFRLSSSASRSSRLASCQRMAVLRAQVFQFSQGLMATNQNSYASMSKIPNKST